MNYETRLQQSKEKAADQLLATKILDLMTKLKLGENRHAERRWLWELIQNAKDVSYDDRKVNIEINLNEASVQPYITFSHNGKPFTTDNITFLIEQVSTKDRQAQQSGRRKVTGKFGTGFLSTHLLSEVVEVKGILQDEDLPARKFSVTLDRSAGNPKGIIDSVNNSLDQVRKVLKAPGGGDSINPLDYNTVFRYPLVTSKLQLAKTGIDELKKALPLTLAFSEQIASIAIEHERVTFQRHPTPTPLGNSIEVVTIVENKAQQAPSQTQILVIRGDQVTIAVPVEYDGATVRMLEIDAGQAKLYCDFPLIGTETFPFPVIVNSSAFNPNEPRSGIWLTNTEDERIAENKELMEEAKSLYFTLLNTASEQKWENLFHIIGIWEPTSEEDWLSKKWFNEQLLEPITDKILHTPILCSEQGHWLPMLSSNEEYLIDFSVADSEDIGQQLWHLLKKYKNRDIPQLQEAAQWAACIPKGCSTVTPDGLAEWIQADKSLEGLADVMETDIDTAIEWLNKFFEMMTQIPSLEEAVANSKYAIIPNQLGNFRKAKELDRDEYVDDILKQVLAILQNDIQSTLIHQSIVPGTIEMELTSAKDIIDDINKRLQDKNIEIDKKYEACDILMALFSDAEEFQMEHRTYLYNTSKLFYPSTVPDKTNLKFFYPDIWEQADKIQVKAMITTIHSESMLEFQKQMEFSTQKETLSFLDEFVTFIINQGFESLLNSKTHPILPNQIGQFRIKDELYLDDGEIEPHLKEILQLLKSDFVGNLLMKEIYLELPANRTKTRKDAADEIYALVLPRLSELPRRTETQEIFSKLIFYFNEYPEHSAALFGDLYLNKSKLYDEALITENNRKAELWDKVMAENGITSKEELEGLIKQVIKQRQDTEIHKEITADSLVGMGIGTPELFMEIANAPFTAALFHHVSTPTPEMYEYAQKLLRRARKRIIAYLRKMPAYDLSVIDEITDTIIGIRKNGADIHVVMRPSDDGKVLLYHPAEINSLKSPNSELWIEDGNADPALLTLGKILELTGINKIPLNGNA